jgi:hypothetical protein
MGRAESLNIYLEGMSSFAEAALIDKAYSTTISRVTFASFFIPNGLLKLMVFDARSDFARAMTKMMYTSIGIQYHTIAKESHKAILNERFRHISKANDMKQRTLPST